MPDDFEQSDDHEDRLVQLKRSQIRVLEDKAKRADDAEARAAAAERELAFSKAGVPADNPMAPYFVRGYDGDLSADAIRAAAVEAGLMKPEVREETPANEQQVIGRVLDAAAGGSTIPNREAEMNAALREAKTPEEFDRVYTQYGGQLSS